MFYKVNLTKLSVLYFRLQCSLFFSSYLISLYFHKLLLTKIIYYKDIAFITQQIFGGFVSTSWDERNTGHKTLTYFGTGESFVFRLSPRPVKYAWTGLQKEGLGTTDLFMAGDDKSLMIGGG